MASLHHKAKAHRVDLQDDVEKIKAALFDTSVSFKDLIGDAYHQSLENVKEKSTEYKDEVGSYISAKPFTAVGVSILSGFLLGYFLRRK